MEGIRSSAASKEHAGGGPGAGASPWDGACGAPMLAVWSWTSSRAPGFAPDWPDGTRAVMMPWSGLPPGGGLTLVMLARAVSASCFPALRASASDMPARDVDVLRPEGPP